MQFGSAVVTSKCRPLKPQSEQKDFKKDQLSSSYRLVLLDAGAVSRLDLVQLGCPCLQGVPGLWHQTQIACKVLLTIVHIYSCFF